MPTPRRSPRRSPGWYGCAGGSPAARCRRCSAACKACKDAHLPLWQPVASSLLGLALVMLDALDEAVPLLEGAVNLSRRAGCQGIPGAVEDAPCRGACWRRDRTRAPKCTPRRRWSWRSHTRSAAIRPGRCRICGEVAAQDGADGMEEAEAYFAEASDAGAATGRSSTLRAHPSEHGPLLPSCRNERQGRRAAHRSPVPVRGHGAGAVGGPRRRRAQAARDKRGSSPPTTQRSISGCSTASPRTARSK